jgi:hypothetical protein
MQTLPNQESLLQNQVFLAAQYSSTYLRFPYPCGEGSGVGVGEGGKALPHRRAPHPDPPPAETAYTRVSATQ